MNARRYPRRKAEEASADISRRVSIITGTSSGNVWQGNTSDLQTVQVSEFRNEW